MSGPFTWVIRAKNLSSCAHLNTGQTGGLSEWKARFLAPVLTSKSNSRCFLQEHFFAVLWIQPRYGVLFLPPGSGISCFRIPDKTHISEDLADIFVKNT